MRIIEPESKQGVFLLIIVVLILSYFGWYILAGVVLVLLFFWLFLCSSKIINPTNPQGIVSPINGRITELKQEDDSIILKIETKWNARVYSPSDLKNIMITHVNGFYFPTKNATANLLGAYDKLEANILLGEDCFKFKMSMFPLCFKICTLHCDNNEALFLDKIGFLNMGVICLEVNGKNIQACVNQGDRVLAGITTIISQKKQDNEVALDTKIE